MDATAIDDWIGRPNALLPLGGERPSFDTGHLEMEER
jgi:hypothetical protein